MATWRNNIRGNDRLGPMRRARTATRASSNCPRGELTPAGVVTVLYSFPNTSGEYDCGQLAGAEPNTNLIRGSDGNLYGTALQDGAYDRGHVG
jgi:hypothetical protein